MRKSRGVYGTRKKREFDIQKFLANLIVIFLPIMIFCLSANIVLRLGEVYEFSLNSSEIMENTTIATTKDDVVGTFSSFMQHRMPELTLMENVEYEPQDIFSSLDKKAMAGLRGLLDVLLAIGAIAFLVTLVSYFFLIRWRVKAVFMKRFKIAALVLLIIEVVNAVINLVPVLRTAVYGGVFGRKFPDGDNLILLLSDQFPFQVTMFEIIVGGILLALMTYITWSVAGRRKYFKRF